MEKICQNCTKKYQAKSNKAKFCSSRCKVAFARNEQKPDVLQTIMPQDKPAKEEPTEDTFIPNWKRNGYASKEDAMMQAMAQVMKNVPNAVITWNNKVWDAKSFSKNLKDKSTPRFGIDQNQDQAKGLK